MYIPEVSLGYFQNFCKQVRVYNPMNLWDIWPKFPKNVWYESLTQLAQFISGVIGLILGPEIKGQE